MILLAVIVSWYNWWYLFLELFSISNGLTVNEVINRHRYRYLYTSYIASDDTVKIQFKNPFTKGFVQNWLNFLIN